MNDKIKLSNKDSESSAKQHVGTYIYGIDYLRVIFCVSVVMWHEVNKNSPLPNNSATTLFQYLFGIGYLDFLLLAVPSFLLVSCFLFLYRGGTLDRLKLNMKYLFLTFIFWVFIRDLMVGGINDVITLLTPHDLTGLFTLISGGTFGLYYFFISLIIVQLITYILKNLKFVYIIIGLFLSSTIIFYLSFYAERTGNNLFVQYFSPVSFITVPFLALILYKLWNLKDRKKILLSAVFLVSYLIVRIIEWYLLVHFFFVRNIQPGFPLYARPSLYLISMVIIILSFLISKKPPKIISLVSKYSLAIYVTHILFLSISHQIIGSFTIFSILHLADIATTLVCIALAMVFSTVFAKFIKRNLLFS